VVGVMAHLALFFIAHIAYPERAGAGFLSGIDGIALLLAVLAGWALMGLRWGVVTVLACAALLGLGLRLSGWG
jgi:chromate transporter